MMLERYRKATRAIQLGVARKVIKMLGLRRQPHSKDALFRILDAAGYCQADLVLCLLRLDARREVEGLIGKKIQVCPTHQRWIAPPLSPTYNGDRRKILRLAPNPCLPTTGAFQRYRILRVGMTVEQARKRGVKDGDLRNWGRKQYLEVG